MQIGMMADVYKPHVSGITNYIDLNKRYLEAAGHDVYIFTFGDEDFQDDEDHVIRSPGLPLQDTGFYLSLTYSLEARKMLRKMDIVHVHHPFLSGQLTLRHCKPRGIPVLFTNHTRYDLLAQAYIPHLPEGVGESFLKAYLPNFCDSVELVVAPSPGMKAILTRLGVKAHIEVVPNGVDIAPFQSVDDPFRRTELGFQEDDIVLVYSGRLGPEKNLPFLLRAFNGVAHAYDNVYLLIVGDGPERDNLEDRVRHMGINHRVKFTGMVKYDQIPRYLAISDAFLTASVSEVHPLSVIEAMASGLSVLGIKSPGVGDTVLDGKTGYVIQEEDLAVYTAKMIRLVTDHDLRKEMNANARKESQKYAIERTTQIMLGHYQRLVEDSYGKKRSLQARFYQFLDRFRR